MDLADERARPAADHAHPQLATERGIVSSHPDSSMKKSYRPAAKHATQ